MDVHLKQSTDLNRNARPLNTDKTPVFADIEYVARQPLSKPPRDSSRPMTLASLFFA